MRAVIVLPLLLASCLFAQLQPGNYLLLSQEEIAAAKSKAERQPWARKVLDHLLADAEHAITKKVELPDRGGQWPHWYSCKRDGARLQTDSPVKHRCPVCGTVYTGEPYDSVVLYDIHRAYSQAIRDCGLAYRFTGRAVFAQHAAAILDAYATRYGTYKLHDIDGLPKVRGGHIMAQTLDESTWLIPAAWGYALVRETIPEATRKHIEQDLFLAAANVIRADRRGIHNIQCWKNSAVALAGYVSGNSELVREAIEDPDRGFRVQVEKGVTADGLWYEGSLGYHTYTMDAIWPLTEAARHSGLDLYNDRYRTLWDAPLALALPNGDSPGFNDAAGDNVLNLAPLYELAYARWKKPAYGHVLAARERGSLNALLYGVEAVPAGPMIPAASALLADAGFALLRGGGTTAAVRFGRHGGGHGHPDKLNLVTFAGGVSWGLDPGSINYGVPLQHDWYRTTIAHDTVTVDGKSQAAVDGTLEDWQVRDGSTTLVARADNAYPGVRLRRTVTVDSTGAIADRFECESDAVHVYDWAFHAQGELTTSVELTPQRIANGYQHVGETASAKTDAAFDVSWRAGGRTMTLHFAAAPGTEVIRGRGPGRDPAAMVPMIIVRRTARSTVFAVKHRVQ